MTTTLDLLREIRAHAGERRTIGLPDGVIERFLTLDSLLVQAIEEAHAAFRELLADPAGFEGLGWREALALSESELTTRLQSDYVNFYPAENVNPYVALAARGPWLVTTHGAVLHDSGGYGMLGLGHAPQSVIDAMSRPWVMANVMTPSVSQKRLAQRLRREVGQHRGHCPYSQFICMNSGSEAMSVALRITDIHCMRQTGKGGPKAGRTSRYVVLRGSFHGRTGGPADISHSTLPKYRQFLKSFQDKAEPLIVEANDLEALRRTFEQADADGVFIEAMFLEPVMGEGNPGQAITREFYDLARQLTRERDSLLVVDSIQAGLRGTGYLSIVDYPGFEDCEAPDLESWSKALNAGQYPLSVLACTERAADIYERGVYGNTMTTNPRALEVAVAVLDAVTPALRENIRERGAEMLAKLDALRAEFPDIIVGVRGTGLLLAAELAPDKAQVVGIDGIENWCRRHGVGVIHGGKNALRFTPHFGITSEEIDVVVDVVRAAIETCVGRDATGEAQRGEARPVA